MSKLAPLQLGDQVHCHYRSNSKQELVRQRNQCEADQPGTLCCLLILLIKEMPNARIFASSVEILSTQHRKRKRNITEDDEKEHADEDGTGDSPDPSNVIPGLSATMSLSYGRPQEYHTVGFSPEKGLPPFPFPHRPLSSGESHQISKRTIATELEALNPPVKQYGFSQHQPEPQSTSTSPSETQSHLTVLSAILHQSLLDGEYNRAGRAWHQLLSSGPEGEELKKTIMSLRHHGRWAIGAEVILRRGTQEAQQRLAFVNDGTTRQHISPVTKQCLNENNLRAARSYYDRLAIQYPHHYNRIEKPTDFHVAMLTLWIYEATERSKIERGRIEQERDDTLKNTFQYTSDDDSTILRPPSYDSSAGHSRQHRPHITFDEQLDRVRQSELRAGLEIAARLDDMRASPPADKSIELMRLRAMVSLWLGDLFVPEPWPVRCDNAERRQRELDRDRESRRAKTLLAEVVRRGGRVVVGLERGRH